MITDGFMEEGSLSRRVLTVAMLLTPTPARLPQETLSLFSSFSLCPGRGLTQPGLGAQGPLRPAQGWGTAKAGGAHLSPPGTHATFPHAACFKNYPHS